MIFPPSGFTAYAQCSDTRFKKHSGVRESIAEMAANAGFGEWVHEHLPDVAMGDQVRYSCLQVRTSVAL
jgi:hypothetical protein